MLQIWQELKLRANNQVRWIVGSGAPVDGTTGANDCGPGSMYVDVVTGFMYRNIGTAASPIWSSSGSKTEERALVAIFSTAQVNAGATILPALAGIKYQIVDMTMIAIGGNAATATAVVINATQAASGVSLLSVAIAALTRSAVVRAGAANATVLTDGASFNPCDVNTAITIAQTGSALATATGIMVIIRYLLTA